MSGSIKWVVYVADSGAKYAVKMDESNSELENSGFEDYTDSMNLPALPRNLAMRFVNCINPATGATRAIPIGKKNSSLFQAGGIILLTVISALTGSLLPFDIVSAIQEKTKGGRPFAGDTGLIDGDAT